MKQVATFLLLAMPVTAAAVQLVQPQQAFLSVEAAFPLSAEHKGNTAKLQWRLPDGYHLYRDKISVQVNGKVQKLSIQQKPAFRPDFEVGFQYLLKGLVEVIVHDIPDNSTLEVRFQGCSAAGLCYPPQRVEVPHGRL